MSRSACAANLGLHGSLRTDIENDELVLFLHCHCLCHRIPNGVIVKFVERYVRDGQRSGRRSEKGATHNGRLCHNSAWPTPYLRDIDNDWVAPNPRDLSEPDDEVEAHFRLEQILASTVETHRTSTKRVQHSKGFYSVPYEKITEA